MLSQFKHHVVTVQYKAENVNHNFYCQDVYQYLEDIISNPYLFKKMVFDAQILSKFNSQEFQRFYDEPWTAKRWYELQVCAVLVAMALLYY